jgi:hypothetical protein
MGRKSCPFDREFDFDFRPPGYEPEFPTEEAFLSRIKGMARRDIARRALDGEELVRLGDEDLYRGAMEFVLQEELDERERQRWGSFHPEMMGGEFLPAWTRTRWRSPASTSRPSRPTPTASAREPQAVRSSNRVEGSTYEISPSTR